MKVLLIKDVYKLGHAGDVKKVADGFGRNYLIPQGLAILATPGAMKQAESIRSRASATRQVMNAELGGLASLIEGQTLTFTSKAGETGKLYGSITTQIVADELSKLVGTQIDRKQVESQPIRSLGEHKAKVRLTMDLTPEIKVIVLREGEAIPPAVIPVAEKKAEKVAEATPAPVVESATEEPDEPVSADGEAIPSEVKPVAKKKAEKVAEATPAPVVESATEEPSEAISAEGEAQTEENAG